MHPCWDLVRSRVEDVDCVSWYVIVSSIHNSPCLCYFLVTLTEFVTFQLLWQNGWQQPLRAGRLYFGSVWGYGPSQGGLSAGGEAAGHIVSLAFCFSPFDFKKASPLDGAAHIQAWPFFGPQGNSSGSTYTDMPRGVSWVTLNPVKRIMKLNHHSPLSLGVTSSTLPIRKDKLKGEKKLSLDDN